MKAYIEKPQIVCPSCQRQLMRYLIGAPDAETLTLMCDCDGIAYSIPRPFVTMTRALVVGKLRRFDTTGRDVTHTPGLWDETDTERPVA